MKEQAMKYRQLGKTGYKVSEIGFGAWAIGGSWGQTNDQEALTALHTAADAGINFFDTADVYGNGHSETLLAKFRKERQQEIYIVTKAGRALNPHVASGYSGKNIEKFIDASRKRLQMDTLDLVQLHCPPTQVFYQPELFAHLDDLVEKGKIRHYGVSVEKVEEAMKAIEYPGVSTVQIIYNLFRQRPQERFFALANKQQIGIIVRVPLASGLLTGKISASSTFESTDHRLFNRHGESFDVGETFAGVPFELGLAAVEKLKTLVPKDFTLAQMALKWILMQSAVSTVIAGARRPAQVAENVTTSALPDLSPQTMKQIGQVYETLVKPAVHHRW
jgi:aryl-alcohol dehydrogenase-like predicted oxidoreductase